MGHKMYNLVLKAQHNYDAQRIFEDLYHKAYKELQKFQEKSVQEQPSKLFVSSTKFVVLDPDKSVTEGRKKRIKGHFEKKKMNIKNKEFGSTTPNKHII